MPQEGERPGADRHKNDRPAEQKPSAPHILIILYGLGLGAFPIRETTDRAGFGILPEVAEKRRATCLSYDWATRLTTTA